MSACGKLITTPHIVELSTPERTALHQLRDYHERQLESERKAGTSDEDLRMFEEEVAILDKLCQQLSEWFEDRSSDYFEKVVDEFVADVKDVVNYPSAAEPTEWASMQHEMREAFYDLQYHIYIIALHRFLAEKLTLVSRTIQYMKALLQK